MLNDYLTVIFAILP